MSNNNCDLIIKVNDKENIYALCELDNGVIVAAVETRCLQLIIIGKNTYTSLFSFLYILLKNL